MEATTKMAEAFLLELSAAVIVKKEVLALSLSVLSSADVMGTTRPLCADVQELETELQKIIGCEGKPAKLLGAKHLLVSRLLRTKKALFIAPGMAYNVYIEAE